MIVYLKGRPLWHYNFALL